MPELAQDARFATTLDRARNQGALKDILEASFRTRDVAHWLAVFRAAGVPHSAINGYEQALADPQVQARRMVVDIEHPKIGPMKMLGLPIKSTGDLTAIRAPAPWLGQHSREVLRDIGYGAAEIAELFKDQVVFDAAAANTRPVS